MRNKDKYHQLCETEKTLPIFSRDWWLDTVCGAKRWDVFIIEEKGRILAALPIYIPTSDIISMPCFTQTMGPWLFSCSPDTKYTTALGQRQALCKEFVKELDQYSHFLQNFHYAITDWLPFYWAGYQQTTRYTYLLKDIKDQTALWENMSQNIRRNITKAQQKHIFIQKGIPIEDFLTIQAKTFERQHIRMKEDTQVLKDLIHTCQQRKQGDLWGGYDEEGHLYAAAFIVWQEQSAYYLAGGGDPAYRDSGAHSYVLWEGIHFVSQFTDIFDFEGSMIPGVERFFREFGAIQTPFFTISKGKLSLLDRARIKLSRLR